MPPKPQKPPVGKAKGTDEAKEEPLQAVVLADTFENKFAPFTLERPRCLLPLANTPLIEYTLEFLASAGVQEVYLYAGAHVDQVETYINASRWKQPSSLIRKVSFLRCAATSVGDVMRDLDQKGFLVGDFFVVSGDAVCDFPISKALKKHKARREKSKDAIMTMLLRETDSPRPSHNVATFAIDPSKDRCLHYEEISQKAVYGMHIDPEALKSPELDIRQDLVDCRIDICTPDVLSLWSDNFDNQAPRKDFLFGVLKDFELNGKTIHTHIVQSQFAARIADLPTYAQISEDIINGAIQSLKIENNVSPDTHYKRGRQGAAADHGVVKSRPSDIDANSMIGAGTNIGANTVIRTSVIGRRCHIGTRTNIESSYIWDNVSIGNGTRISRAIVGSDASIGENCTIGEGALVSFGVRIASGTNVPAGVKITKAHKPGPKPRTEKALVGADGEGHEYSEDEDEDEDADGIPGLVYEEAMFADSASTLASDMSEPTSPINGSRSHSFATSISDDDGIDRFQHDTVAILVQRMQEGHDVDDMLSELMGLRFSGGADESQVRRAVAAAMAKRVTSLIDNGVAAAEASKQILKAYSTLIRRGNAEQAVSEQVEFLLDVQRELSRRNEGGKALLFLTKDLYDLEVFGEDALLGWWNDARSNTDSNVSEVRSQTAPFIEWLESAESESEEEDEED